MKWVTKTNLITWFEEFDLVCSAIFKVPFPTNQIKERESNSLHLNSKKNNFTGKNASLKSDVDIHWEYLRKGRISLFSCRYSNLTYKQLFLGIWLGAIFSESGLTDNIFSLKSGLIKLQTRRWFVSHWISFD